MLSKMLSNNGSSSLGIFSSFCFKYAIGYRCLKPSRSDRTTRWTHRKTPSALLTMSRTISRHPSFVLSKFDSFSNIAIVNSLISARVRQWRCIRRLLSKTSRNSVWGRLLTHIFMSAEDDHLWRLLASARWSVLSPSYSSSPSMKKKIDDGQSCT